MKPSDTPEGVRPDLGAYAIEGTGVSEEANDFAVTFEVDLGVVGESAKYVVKEVISDSPEGKECLWPCGDLHLRRKYLVNLC